MEYIRLQTKIHPAHPIIADKTFYKGKQGQEIYLSVEMSSKYDPFSSSFQ